MRKLILLTALFFTLCAEAQDTLLYRNAVSIGIGARVRMSADYPGYYDIENNLCEEYPKYSPIFNVGYRYMINRHWGVGTTASLFYSSRKKKYIDSGETADKKSETLLAMMLTARYYWRTKNWVRVYSSVGAGFCYEWDKNYMRTDYRTYLRSSWQVSPLGIEVGKGHLIGFCELGLGWAGWLQGGIGYRF